MSKKQKNFKQWQEDDWDDDYVKRDGKRYDAKREAIKQQRGVKSSLVNKIFDERE